ncbi:oligosaccharide flippase family protein [Blastococcus sp. SYSU DS0973]
MTRTTGAVAAATSTRGGRPARTHAYLSAAYVATGIANYGFAIALVNVLTSDDYARFSAAQAVILIATTVAGAAIPWLVAREVAAAGDDLVRRRRAVGFGLVVNGAAGLLAAVLAAVVCAPFATPAQLAIVCVAVTLPFVAATAQGWAQGRGRYGQLSAMMLTHVLVKVASGFLLALGYSTTGALAGSAIGAAVVAVAGLYLMRGDLAKVGNVRRAGALWKGAVGMAVLSTAVTFMASVDALVVVLVAPDDPDVGAYQLANVIGRIPLFLAAPLALTVFPRLAGRPGDLEPLVVELRRLCVLVVPLWAALATVPDALGRGWVPGGYTAVLDLLPLTATNGLACCLLTLLVTRHKAQMSKSTLWLWIGASGLMLLLVTAGGLLGDVRGLAWAAALGACAVAVAMWLVVVGHRRVLQRTGWVSVPLGAAALLALTQPWPPLWLLTGLALAPLVLTAGFGALPIRRLRVDPR